MNGRAAIQLLTTTLAVTLLLPIASEAQARGVGQAPLAQGAGYGQHGGSARVRTLQRSLRQAGEDPGPVDGLFGPLTHASVVRFQGRHGLAVDGVVGPHTRKALADAASVLRPGAGIGSRHGSARVKALQRRLRAAGVDPGRRDGRFGPRTEAAVLGFQQRHGLTADGIAGPATLKRLAHVARTGQAEHASNRSSTASAPRTVQATPPRPSRRQAPAEEDSGNRLWILVAGLLLMAPFVVRAVTHRPGRRARSSPSASGGGESPRMLGYIRVSRADTEELAQITAIEAECARRGLELVGVVRETEPIDDESAVTGGGLPFAANMIDEGVASGVVVADLRAVAESADDARALVEEWATEHRRLVSAYPPLDTEEAHRAELSIRSSRWPATRKEV